MSDKWPKVPLSQVATAVIGGTPSRNVAEYWDGDIPWATAKDVASIPGRYLVQVPEFITQRGLDNSAAKLLPKGTVLITARGTVGALAQLGGRMAFNQTCYALLPRDRLDNDFLFYALRGSIAELYALTYGTVFETITTQTLDHWAVPLPPLPDQRAIAAILGALDDKIELNRRMNHTLEAMARAIFKSWFVDFDPVRAKAEGRDPGLPDHIAALFPDEFDESDIGEIPRGWTVGPIGELVEAVGGSTPRTTEPAYWDDGLVNWATPKDLARLTSPALTETARGITEEGLSQISSGLLPEGTVLLSSRAPVGYLAIAEIPVAINQGFIAMKCSGPLSKYYVLWWTEFNMQLIRRHAGGTTFQEISKRSFRPLPALVPSQEVMQVFDATADPLYRAIVNNEQESRTLAHMRDGLLPRLISGELRVPDVERFVEAQT